MGDSYVRQLTVAHKQCKEEDSVFGASRETKRVDQLKPRNQPSAPTKYPYDPIAVQFEYSFPVFSAPYAYVARNAHHTAFRTRTVALLSRLNIWKTFRFLIAEKNQVQISATHA